MPRVPQRLQAFSQLPFDGGRGVSLYLGIGSGPGVDPGPNSIKFRSLRLIPQGRKDKWKRGTKWVRGSGFDYGNGVRKTSAVAVVKHPATSIDYTLPPELADRIVWAQLCVHDQHVENRTNYRPIRLNLDGSLEHSDDILGTGRLMSIEKRDGGIYRMKFVYDRSLIGLQPTEFVLTKISGTGTIADVTVSYVGPKPLFPRGKRSYEIDTPALTDGAAYVFNILARNGVTTQALVGNAGDGSADIELTADAAGPPAPSNLTATAE